VPDGIRSGSIFTAFNLPGTLTRGIETMAVTCDAAHIQASPGYQLTFITCNANGMSNDSRSTAAGARINSNLCHNPGPSIVKLRTLAALFLVAIR